MFGIYRNLDNRLIIIDIGNHDDMMMPSMPSSDMDAKPKRTLIYNSHLTILNKFQMNKKKNSCFIPLIRCFVE